MRDTKMRVKVFILSLVSVLFGLVASEQCGDTPVTLTSPPPSGGVVLQLLLQQQPGGAGPGVQGRGPAPVGGRGLLSAGPIKALLLQLHLLYDAAVPAVVLS